MAIDTKITEKYLNEARDMLKAKRYSYVLNSVRRGLEYIVKTLCKDSGIPYNTSDVNLDSMIKNLNSCGVTSNNVTRLMHQTRRSSNIGAHLVINNDGKEEEVTINQAKEAFDNYKDLCEKISKIDYSEITASVQDINNSPMKYPDYYSSERRHYGEWRNKAKKELLLVDSSYGELYSKAVGQEDVEAMLTLAIGFLPREIKWKDDVMLHPDKTGAYWNPDLNYEYYYWALRAVYFAVRHFKEGKFVPKKYIATAIWDTCNYLEKTVASEVFGAYGGKYNQFGLYYDIFNIRTPETVIFNKLHNLNNIKAINLFGISNYDLVDLYHNIPQFIAELKKLSMTIFNGEPVVAVIHQGANFDTLGKLGKINAYLSGFDLKKAELIMQKLKKDAVMKNNLRRENEKREDELRKKDKEKLEEYDKKIEELFEKNSILKLKATECRNERSSIFAMSTIAQLKNRKKINQLSDEIDKLDSNIYANEVELANLRIERKAFYIKMLETDYSKFVN